MRLLVFALFILTLQPASARHKNKVDRMHIDGCWARTTAAETSRWPPSGQTLCFNSNGEFWGVDVAAGHGADFGGQWKSTGRGRISITFITRDATENMKCSFWTDQSRDMLILTNCEAAANWNTLWRRDFQMERSFAR